MTASNHRRPTQPGAPALIEHENLKFLIVNNPAQATLPQFIKVHTCVCVAGVCVIFITDAQTCQLMLSKQRAAVNNRCQSHCIVVT